MSIDLKTLDHLEPKYLTEMLNQYSSDFRIELSPSLQKLALEIDLLNINKIHELTSANQLFFFNKIKELNYGIKNMPKNPDYNCLVLPFAVKLVPNPHFDFQQAVCQDNINGAIYLQYLDENIEYRVLRKRPELAKDLKSILPKHQIGLAHRHPEILLKIKNPTDEAIEIVLNNNHRLITQIPRPQWSDVLYALNKEYLVLQTKNLTVSNYEGVVDKALLTLYKQIPQLEHFDSHDEALNYVQKMITITRYL